MSTLLESKNVKQLREIAKRLQIKPLPSRKTDIIDAILVFPEDEVRDAIERPWVPAAPTEEPTIPIECKGTKKSLLAYLRAQNALTEYRDEGADLSLLELQKVCIEYHAMPKIEEEKITNEYRLLIQELDPDLFAVVKDFLSFIPDPRALLSTERPDSIRLLSAEVLSPDKRVLWNPWRELYEEINGLFDVIGTPDTPGARPEFAAVLDYIQTDTFFQPPQIVLQAFDALFPILSYVYAHKDKRFRWLLAEKDIEGPFMLSKLIPDTHRQARIPYLIHHPPSAVVRRWGKKRAYENEITHLLYTSRVAIFFHNDKEVLDKFLEIATDTLQSYLKYRQWAGKTSEWVKIAVYILRQSPTYKGVHDTAIAILKANLPIPDELRATAEQLPVPKQFTNLEDITYAVLTGLARKVMHLVRDAVLSAGHNTLRALLRFSFQVGSEEVVRNIIQSGRLREEEVYIEALVAPSFPSSTSIDEKIALLEGNGLSVRKDIGKIVLAVAQRKYGGDLDALEELLKKYVDPANPPLEIAEVFRIARTDINNMTYVESSPPVGWRPEKHNRFLILMLEYGARTDEEYLKGIEESIVGPKMRPFLLALLDHHVHVPVELLSRTTDIGYALERVAYSDEERLELLYFYKGLEDDDWMIKEIENNPLLTPDVAIAFLKSSHRLSRGVAEAIAKRQPHLTEKDIIFLFRERDRLKMLSDVFAVFNLYNRRFTLELPGGNMQKGTMLSRALQEYPFDPYNYSTNLQFVRFLRDLLMKGTKPDKFTLFFFFKYVERKLIRTDRKLKQKADILAVFNTLSELETEQVELLRDILRAGADPNDVVANKTPLLLLLSAKLSKPTLTGATTGLVPAQQVALLRELIAGGADVNSKEGGTTPLITAVRRGNTEAVRLLIDQGANTEMLDKAGNKAIVHAMQKKNKEMVELLENKGASLESYKFKGKVIYPRDLMKNL